MGPEKGRIACGFIVGSFTLHLQKTDYATQNNDFLVTSQQLQPLHQGSPLK